MWIEWGLGNTSVSLYFNLWPPVEIFPHFMPLWHLYKKWGGAVVGKEGTNSNKSMFQLFPVLLKHVFSSVCLLERCPITSGIITASNPIPLTLNISLFFVFFVMEEVGCGYFLHGHLELLACVHTSQNSEIGKRDTL